MSRSATFRVIRRLPSLAAALLLLSLPACRPDPGSWERIQSSGILKVGLDPTYPPFELAEGSELRGLDVDLANTIAKDLQLRVEFAHIGYDGLYDALKTEQVDVLISALVVSPERLGDFAYSESYFNAGQVLMVPRETSNITGMNDLNGRSLAVEIGAQGHVEAIGWSRRLPALTVVTFNSSEEALLAALEGGVDAALVDAVSGRLFALDHPGFERIDSPVTVEPYAMVVRKEDRRLLEQIDESLAELRDSGRLDALIGRWLGE